MKGKKGILYSLGLTLFALIILTLALLIGKQGDSAESHFIDLIVAQQAQEIQTSTNKAFSEVYLREGNISFSLRETSLTIVENFPEDYNQLKQIFTSLETDIEKNFVGIEINQEKFQSMDGLLLQPLNISYMHGTQGGIHIDQNLQIDSYTLSLIFGGNVTSCTIDFVSGGSFDVSFSVVSPSTNCSDQGTNLQSANISLIAEEQNIYVTLQPNGPFSIVSNVSLVSNLTVGYQPTKNVYVQLPIEVELLESFQNFSQKTKVKLSLPSLD